MLPVFNVPAQSGDVERLLTRALPLAFAVLVAVVAVVLIAAGMRRRLRSGDAGGERSWTLEDLRKLHARGDLDDEEYERLKARMVVEMGMSARAARAVSGRAGGGRERASDSSRADGADGPTVDPRPGQG